MDSVYSVIDFYDNLRLKYSDYLRPQIISIVMMQSGEEIHLESVESEIVEGGFEKHTIKTVNLDFVKDFDDDGEEKPYFDTNDPIENNVRKFINDFSPYSIINTTDLFHDEACKKISRKYKTFGMDS